jgi:hypothetical protein
VTDADLFIPALTFVFGEAQVGGLAAVVSTARLTQRYDGRPASFGQIEVRLLMASPMLSLGFPEPSLVDVAKPYIRVPQHLCRHYVYGQPRRRTRCPPYHSHFHAHLFEPPFPKLIAYLHV